MPENPETGSVEGSFEQHGGYVESENNGEIAIPEPTLEDSSAIREGASGFAFEWLLTGDCRWRF